MDRIVRLHYGGGVEESMPGGFSYPCRFYNGTAMHTYRVTMRAKLNEEAQQSILQEVERNSPNGTDDPSHVAEEYDTGFLL